MFFTVEQIVCPQPTFQNITSIYPEAGKESEVCMCKQVREKPGPVLERVL